MNACSMIAFFSIPADSNRQQLVKPLPTEIEPLSVWHGCPAVGHLCVAGFRRANAQRMPGLPVP